MSDAHRHQRAGRSRRGGASESAAAPSDDRRLAGFVFAVLFVSYAYFFQGGGWNPNARLDLTRALAERGTIAIDAYWTNTGDWAQRAGHRYANKAPGLSFASVPFFLAAGPAARAVFPGDDGAQLLVRAYLTNVAVNALPSALLGVLLFHVLRRLGLGGGPRCAGSALAFGLGTLAFPYATAYYAHQPAAALGFAAFAALLAARRSPSGSRGAHAHALAAGLAAGAAVLVETSAVLVAALLALVALSDRHGLRLVPAYLAGGIPALALVALYNQAAFGAPFVTSLAYANPEVVARHGGALFGPPTPERLWGLVAPPYRGLLFTSPLLVLAPFGVRALHRADARAAWIGVAVPAAFWLLIASFHSWHGGWAPGPRYLVPSLPFLFLPVAFAMARVRAAAVALAVISVSAMLAITLVAVEVPKSVRNPLFDFVLPHLAGGRVSANPQGLDDYFHGRGRRHRIVPETWGSFNLGELVFPHRVASVAPLLACWGAAGAWLVRRRHSG